MSALIDSHCHLDRFQNKGQLEEVLQRAKEAGIGAIVAIGTSTEDWASYREMSSLRPGFLHYTVGLHPSDVDKNWKEQIEQLAPYFIPPHEAVGLGEMGLDFFHLPKDPVEAASAIQRQEAAFEGQLELALQLDCPIVIHSRNAVKECIAMIDESGVSWERVVFHCWTEGPELCREILRRGGKVSFTGIVTFKNAEPVRESVREVGLDDLMIETDAPFLAPEPKRGKSNEPTYLVHTAQYLSETLKVPYPQLAETTARNTRTFFNL